MFPVVWYKIRHPWFDPTRAYRAIAYTLPSETAWGYLVFITENHLTVAVQVWRCTALDPAEDLSDLDREFHRPLFSYEAEQPWAKKPLVPNPDLEVDIK